MPTDFLKFFHTIEQLKLTKRTGWVERGIKGPESISDHMYRMSIMAMIVKDPKLDRMRCIQMALVHDLAESIVGDITPHAPVSKEEKFRLEDEGFKQLCGMLGNSSQSDLMYELWKEYEDAVTPEAKLVKDLDKFEMIVQALEYEKAQNKNLQPFFDSTRGIFTHPEVQAWVDSLYKEREALKV